MRSLNLLLHFFEGGDLNIFRSASSKKCIRKTDFRSPPSKKYNRKTVFTHHKLSSSLKSILASSSLVFSLVHQPRLRKELVGS